MIPSGREVVLLKLGGSLITSKSRARTARPGVIRRLAREIASVAGPRGPRMVVGHGSGSFGHRAAARHGVQEGLRGGRQRTGAVETQREAHELHARVLAALEQAGTNPWSLAPSSFIVGSAGRARRVFTKPLDHALQAGFLPVVYGDVVLDAQQGVAICSTEEVLRVLARRLLAAGHRVARAFWLGATKGVYDEAGRTIPVLDDSGWRRMRRHIVGAGVTDVTGGMQLRVQTALNLSRLGIESWILDGRMPGVLAQAVAGREIPGTHIPAG